MSFSPEAEVELEAEADEPELDLDEDREVEYAGASAADYGGCECEDLPAPTDITPYRLQKSHSTLACRTSRRLALAPR